MRRYLIATAVALSACSAALADTVGDVLKQIAANNLTLQSAAHDMRADVLDIKATNTLGGPSVEYSPFFTKGYSGVAESELVVSQEIDFPTKYAARSKQAQMQQKLMKMQQEMNKAQEEVENSSFTASVGGGAVTAVVSGKKELTALTIKPDVVDPEDVEMLQDLVISAVNEALRQAEEAMESAMGALTGGLNIPGLF